MLFSNHFVRAMVALAFCFTIVPAAAQTNLPWQVTVSKNQHTENNRVVVDLPLPPPGYLLTVERISMVLGPKLHNYTRVVSCEVESSHPRQSLAKYLENKTRLFLPLPAFANLNGEGYYLIPVTDVRIYAVQAQDAFLRLTCDADFLLPAQIVRVSATGTMIPFAYVTPI
jgi:hypothetical protein